MPTNYLYFKEEKMFEFDNGLQLDEIEEKNLKIDLTGNLFSYVNHGCDCQITTDISNDGELIPYLAIKPNKKRYIYTFAAKKGLVMINSKNKYVIDNRKTLEQILSINTEDSNQIKDFINNFGFIIPLPQTNQYFKVNFKEFSEYLNRYIKVAFLMSELDEMESSKFVPDKRINKIFELVSFLIFQKPVSIQIPHSNLIICSNKNTYTDLLYKIGRASDEEFITGTNMFQPFTSVEELYEQIREVNRCICLDEYEGYPYCENIRITNRFYNDILDRGVKIKSISENGKINLGDFTSIKGYNKSFIQDLIKVVKSTIKEDFDFGLKGIHPVFNLDTNSADWKIPDFISALYFALFYKPKTNIYRECANPNCKKVFIVERTNNKKKYCCSNCCNNTSQANSRARKKQALSN